MTRMLAKSSTQVMAAAELIARVSTLGHSEIAVKDVPLTLNYTTAASSRETLGALTVAACEKHVGQCVHSVNVKQCVTEAAGLCVAE
jgi:hypothetical protein